MMMMMIWNDRPNNGVCLLPALLTLTSPLLSAQWTLVIIITVREVLKNADGKKLVLSTNLTPHPLPQFVLFKWQFSATFKALLIAIDMTKEPITKWKLVLGVLELFYIAAKGRVQKKMWKSMVFCQTGGGGVSEGGKKPNCFFEQSIFQRLSRIILGPPKHVLHLVWSAYFISTAVRTALKVARTPQILGGKKGNYRSHYKSKKL